MPIQPTLPLAFLRHLNSDQPIEWQMDEVGLSSAQVWRGASQKTAAVWYLKQQATPCLPSDSLLLEAQKLQYFSGLQLAPRAALVMAAAGQEHLLLPCAEGVLLEDLVMSAADTASQTTAIQAYALILRQIHALPIDACPFSQRLADKIPLVQARIEAGLIDAEDVAAENPGHDVASLHREWLSLRPMNEDLVVVHGDYTLSNAFYAPKTGRCQVIDVGRSGVGDRHQDLAIALRELADFGPAAQTLFLQAYGLAPLDEAKRHFYHLMDEFF